MIIALGGYLYLHSGGSAQATSKASTQSTLDSVKQYLQLPDAVRQRLGMKSEKDAKKNGKKAQATHKGGKGETQEPTGPMPLQEAPFDPYTDTTLLLKNGERVTGKLAHETPDQVTLHWEYGDAAFKSSEIVKIIRPMSRSEERRVGKECRL